MLPLILLVVMPAAMGFNPVVGKALAGLMEPAQLTVVRWALAGLVVLAVALARGSAESWRPAKGTWPLILLLGAGGMGFCSLAAYSAVHTTAATNVSLIYAATSAVVVSFELATGQARASVPLLAGVAACVLGAAVIVTRADPAVLAGLTFTRGDLWAVAGTLVWAAYTIAMKRLPPGLSAFALFAVMGLAGAAAFVPLAAVETASFVPAAPTPLQMAWIAAMVLIASVGSFLSYNIAVRRAGPVLTSAALSLNPLYAALFAWLLVGEQLAAYHAIGGAAIIAGLLLINLDRSRKAARA